MKKYVYTLIIALVATISTSAQNQMEQLLQAGMAYHDQGKYEQAIASYQEMLALDPLSSIAHYEIAMSYMYNKEYDLAIVHSEKAIESGGKLRVAAIVTKASSLSNKNQVQEAIELLEDAIDKYEVNVMVFYNLAICYFKLNDLDNAERALVAGIYDNPLHASSHYMLAILKDNKSLRTESMLSAYFFMALEPKTGRTEKMKQLLERLFMQGVQPSNEKDKKKVINITLKDIELDARFGVVEMGLTLAAAASFEEKKTKNNNQFCERTSTFLELLPTAKQPKESTALDLDFNFYIPFFNALSKAKYTDIFCVYIDSMPSVANQKWLDNNEKKVTAFKKWIGEQAKELIQIEK